MKRIITTMLIALQILITQIDVSAEELVKAAQVVERGSGNQSTTKVNHVPVYRQDNTNESEQNTDSKQADQEANSTGTDNSNTTSSEQQTNEDDVTVFSPSVEVVPIVKDNDLPDYSVPDISTEQSVPPNPKAQPQMEEAEGLEFIVVHRNGIMAFAMIADHEKYKLMPVLARGHVPGRSTVKQMSSSSNAIGAINASYFALSGDIYGNTKINGIIAGTTYYTRTSMAINADGSIFFGRTNYSGRLTFAGKTIHIGGVDVARGANSVIIYNKHQGETTGTNDYGTEYVVINGIITEVYVNKGNNKIPENGYIISLHGTATELFKNAKVGDKVIFDESLEDVDGAGDFNRALHVVGAGPRLVKNGALYVNVDEEQFPADIRIGRAPRTAIGVTKYGDYIIAVVDGRQAHSRGCTLQEWAEILLNDFGAVNAMNLDGGGSTELVVKGDLVNSPSDGRERPVADALVIIRN
ncbi:MAG: phosphodiester glycosidase family protein [Selenomonadaceae bacterium]|nr:phosphodiester glycosidase family protein [Selenomonadaceae bacterium]MBR1858192.1 phosphodiester glycosidase family protein [Selenomonadaceae bacterium]